MHPTASFCINCPKNVGKFSVVPRNGWKKLLRFVAKERNYTCKDWLGLVAAVICRTHWWYIIEVTIDAIFERAQALKQWKAFIGRKINKEAHKNYMKHSLLNLVYSQQYERMEWEDDYKMFIPKQNSSEADQSDVAISQTVVTANRKLANGSMPGS